MPVLLAAHLVQGLGGGLLIALSMALVGTFYDGGLRIRILAALSVTWGIAALVGPPVGGVFAEIGWWRGAFWISVPPIVLFAWASWRMIPASGRTSAGAAWPFHRLGLLALAVLAVGVSGQVVGSGQTVESGLAPPGSITLGAIGASGAGVVKAALILAAVFLVWRAFRLDAVSARPLFPSRVMSLASPVGVAYWVFFFVSFTHVSIAVFMPLVLKLLHGVGPLWLGLFATIFSIAWTLGSVVASGWSGARAKLAMWAGLALTAAANAGLAIGASSAPLWVLAVCVMLIGLGIGVANVHAASWAIATAPEGEQTITASAMPVVRSLGIAFGAAVSFTPFIGFHFALAALLTWSIGGNILASAIGTVVGNPWTFPFIWIWCYRLGSWMLGSGHVELPADLSLSFIFDNPWRVLLPMFLGSLPTGLVAWIAVYWPVRRMVEGYHHRRSRRRERRRKARAAPREAGS